MIHQISEQMKIADNHSIKDIKGQFRQMFPGLKIEFYKQAHGANEGSKATDQHEETKSIGEIRSQHNTLDLVIDPEMSVAQLEGDFEEKMGLHVQVFRKSNALWLQTSSTDNWTLKEQNRKGLASVQS